jgi:hypothetical protein
MLPNEKISSQFKMTKAMEGFLHQVDLYTWYTRDLAAFAT